MAKYFVFIKKEFVRDSQAFIGMTFTDDDLDDIYSSSEMDDGWLDTEGDILVVDLECASKEELYHRINTFYPDASMEIFRVLKVSDTEEVCLDGPERG